jgi:hypothetical protein
VDIVWGSVSQKQFGSPRKDQLSAGNFFSACIAVSYKDSDLK